MFSYKVQDNPEVKGFDVFAKAGGAMKAYIDTETVNVTNGKLTITFTPDVKKIRKLTASKSSRGINAVTICSRRHGISRFAASMAAEPFVARRVDF